MDRFETDLMEDLMADAAEGPAQSAMDGFDEYDGYDDDGFDADGGDEGDDEFIGRLLGGIGGIAALGMLVADGTAAADHQKPVLVYAGALFASLLLAPLILALVALKVEPRIPVDAVDAVRAQAFCSVMPRLWKTPAASSCCWSTRPEHSPKGSHASSPHSLSREQTRPTS